MRGGKAGEIVSRRETPSQCGRVGSPAEAEGIKNAIFKLNLFNVGAAAFGGVTLRGPQTDSEKRKII